MKYLLILSAFLLAAVCNPKPPTPIPVPTPATDAGPPVPVPAPTPAPAPTHVPGNDEYDDACNNLQKIGCSDGKASNCAASMRLADQTAVTRTPIKIACLTTATTVSAAKACGFVVCK